MKVVVLEVAAPASPEVVYVGPDASPTPVYVPGTASGGSDADRPTRTEVTAEIGNAVIAHVLDPDPHPVYDNLPDLTLWFDNALI